MWEYLLVISTGTLLPLFDAIANDLVTNQYLKFYQISAESYLALMLLNSKEMLVLQCLYLNLTISENIDFEFTSLDIKFIAKNLITLVIYNTMFQICLKNFCQIHMIKWTYFILYK